MKKTVIIYIALLSGFLANAQFGTNVFGRDPILNLQNFDKQRVHWGYFLGFNNYDFKYQYINTPDLDIQVKSVTGFNVGLVGNLRINEYLDIRFEPGLYYGQRDLTYSNFEEPEDRLRSVKSTYIHFPLLLKFSALRTGNVRPYLVGGVSRAINLGANEDAQEDNASGIFRMKRWTNNYEVGFGVDLYFEYFKFSPSIRGIFGLEDELIRDNDPNSPYTGNIGAMKTRAVVINFTFH